MENQTPQLHVTGFRGRSFDINLNELDVGVLSSDEQVRTALANYLDVPPAKLQAFTIDRNEQTGHLTVFPDATFG